jgi:hypothetical protein|tara:strand:+ start:313 stop:489 length:177 start_codon:yes stop_codon:yes gene_type:complete
MKLITTLTLLILISGCAVAGLAKTAVTTTVKVAEVPFKVIGSIVDGEEDKEDSDNEDE